MEYQGLTCLTDLTESLNLKKEKNINVSNVEKLSQIQQVIEFTSDFIGKKFICDKCSKMFESKSDLEKTGKGMQDKKSKLQKSFKEVRNF